MRNESNRVSTIADRLREGMELRGKKQVDLVQATGLCKGAISNYLSGRYEPKWEAMCKLALALDVSKMWLAGYDVPMERAGTPAPNCAISDIVQLLRSDDEFFSIVDKVFKMSPEKRHNLNVFLE